MKIICPKCQSTYKVDLPDPGGAEFDVQCGKCLTIFLFTPDSDQSSHQRGVPDIQSKASDLIEDHPAEDILPPQKRQEQVVSGDKNEAPEAKKQPLSSPEIPYELEDDLELELIPEDPEPIEIIIEDVTADESLEEETLDEIWNQAVDEGALKKPGAPKKSHLFPSASPTWEEAFADQAHVEARWRREQEVGQIREEQELAEALGVEFIPPKLTPIEELVKKPPTKKQQEQADSLFAEARSNEAAKKRRQTKKLPTLEERHREVDKIVTRERTREKPQKKAHPAKKSTPLPSIKERQRDIDLIISRHKTLGKDQLEPDTSSPLPSMDERQREIDEFIIAQKVKQKPSKGKTPEEKPSPLPSLDERHQDVDSLVARERAKLVQEVTQEDIDLEEEVIIDEEEAIPSWEDAFAHQAEVEAGWRKSKEQDRIQEEQQLAEAMGEEYVPSPPPAEVTAAPATAENKQAEVDDIFAQMKAQAAQPTSKAASPPSGMEKRQDEVGRVFAEAKTRQSQEKTQEDIDHQEEVTIDEEEAMPSWEDAFAHQTEVEAGWRKSKEQDRIQEEQQLAEAMGEEYVPSPPPVEVTAAPATAENKQAEVDDIFAQMKAQAEAASDPQAEAAAGEADEEYEPTWSDAFADQTETESTWSKSQDKDKLLENQELQDALEASGEAAASPTEKEATPFDHTFSGDIDLTDELINLDMMELVEQAFKEETESGKTDDPPATEILETPMAEESVPEPELTLEAEPPQEAPAAEPEPVQAQTESVSVETSPTEQTTPVAQTEEPEQSIDEVIDHYDSYVDPPTAPEPEAEALPEMTLESAEEMTLESAEETTLESAEEMTLESAEEMTLEFAEETSHDFGEEEPASPDPVKATFPEEPVFEMETAPDTTATPAPAEAEAEPAFEMESLPELPLESAGESPPEPVEEEFAFAELEPQETTFETIPELEIETVAEPAAAEAPPELEIEPTVEPVAETASAESAIDKGEEDVYRDEELWAELFPSENKEGEPAAETQKAVAETGNEEPFGGGDFWDQVLEKDPAEPGAAAVTTAQGAAESESLTDDELWSQAFPDDENIPLEPAAARERAAPPHGAIPVVAQANAKTDDEEWEEFPELDEAEAAFTDYEEDENFELRPRKRKLGPFTIPRGRRGDMVVGGALMVFLLLAGGVYFTLETFAPGDLTDMMTAKTDVPEGLTPRGDILEDLTGDLTPPKDPKTTPPVDTAGDKGSAVLSDPSKILEASPEEKGILEDLAGSKILNETGKSQSAKVEESSSVAPSLTSVTMSTIIPVAYNPTDIRVLSFSVEMQLSDARSAKQVRESLPAYEAIMTQTVEDFLSRKFYNDILYVKENLQKRLHTAMNKSIKNGRVKKTRFVDFAIQ